MKARDCLETADLPFEVRIIKIEIPYKVYNPIFWRETFGPAYIFDEVKRGLYQMFRAFK
jgi:hypothetical protein